MISTIYMTISQYTKLGLFKSSINSVNKLIHHNSIFLTRMYIVCVVFEKNETLFIWSNKKDQVKKIPSNHVGCNLLQLQLNIMMPTLETICHLIWIPISIFYISASTFSIYRLKFRLVSLCSLLYVQAP